MSEVVLSAIPLTKEAFAPYGDVIELEGAQHFPINNGTIERHHDLATVSVGASSGGRTLISVFSANEVTELPAQVSLVERHPLGSQAFIPMHEAPMMVVVAAVGNSVEVSQLRAFVTNGRQGVNYYPGVWHMPMIASELGQQVLIVDRGGPGNNCDELYFEGEKIFVEVA